MVAQEKNIFKKSWIEVKILILYYNKLSTNYLFLK